MSACGKKREAQPPPSLKTELVLDLFHALENGNHQLAIEKIRRLRDLKDSTYLGELELNETQNLFIKQIQDKLDEGNITDAINICNKGIETLDRNERLLEVMKTLQTLKKINDLTELIINPENRIELARAAATLKTISSNLPEAIPLTIIAEQKLLTAKQQMQRENKIALIDFSCDIIKNYETNSKICETLLLFLANDDPFNPLILWLEQHKDIKKINNISFQK
ncbi:MAG TPA: hypothetical protein P5105_02245 [Victivallales bacterium]|nr:hypothetical protein [Victivallales bacterium]